MWRIIRKCYICGKKIGYCCVCAKCIEIKFLEKLFEEDCGEKILCKKCSKEVKEFIEKRKKP